MPHPTLDARVHLARHRGHPDAIAATITGPDTRTASALLSVHGFRPAHEQTMVLARIDHEEPYYADQAARALRAQGADVEIGAGLQEDIDTEWTWANYPMPWLTREEIREVSAEAQTIHDDIVSGRLVIHAHAHDGHTFVAVGTYRHNGQSIHLHGEDHLRQVALVYDDPIEALAEFDRLNGDAVRPGPAPATDIGQRAALALTSPGTATQTPEASGLQPMKAERESVPVWAASPGDHEALLESFPASQPVWERHRTWSDETTIAAHESLALRVEFLHEAVPEEFNWTIAAYESPVGPRTWHASVTAATPVEIIETLLNSLSAEEIWGPSAEASVMEKSVAQATRPLDDAAWPQKNDGRRLQWTSPSGDPVGVQFDAFAAQAATDGPLGAWTMWGGNTPDHPAWAIHLSTHAPASLLQDLAFELAHGQTTRPARPSPPPQPRLALHTSRPLPPLTTNAQPTRRR
ncbi:DUF317 domain-containing protein [Streptomyces olivoreticuli]